MGTQSVIHLDKARTDFVKLVVRVGTVSQPCMSNLFVANLG